MPRPLSFSLFEARKAVEATQIQKFLEKWHARKGDMSQKLLLLACKEGGGGESSRKWSSLLTNGKEIFVMGRPPGDHQWKDITAVFNFLSTAKSASFVLCKYYVSFAHCEETYFFRSLGWSSPLAASSNTLSAISAPAENSAEPILRILQACLVFENAKAMESLHMQVGNVCIRLSRCHFPNTQPLSTSYMGPSAPANRTVGTVAGVIDGKCEHGYLVTATVGTQKLRGVLFHPVEECVNQAANVSGESESSNVRVVCHRRRRKKLSKRDPKHPKPNRSGYNFFFAEQCARLKPLHPGCDREISKLIGDLWNKLTETEKAVYQENGVKDKERYKSEMAVYEEQRKTGPVISDDVQIQHRPPEPVGVMADADSKMVIDKRGLPEGDENGTGSDNSSETEGKDSDLSSGWEAFELRRRDGLQVGAEADHPSSSEESKKVSEPSIDPK